MTENAARRLLVSCGAFFFRFRNAVFPLAVAALLALSPPAPTFGDWNADRWVDALGIAVCFFGQGIRALVIGLAYIRRGGKDGRVHADDLVIEGIFAHSRNPLYLGNLLVFAGLFLVAGSPLLTVLGVPFFAFAYASIIAAEEDFLGRKFGAAYETYRREVPRLWPRLRGMSATVRSMRFDWRAVLRKEYGSTFTWMTMLVCILAWEAWIAGGRESFDANLPMLALAEGAVVVAYATIRILKKSGRLRATGAPAAG